MLSERGERISVWIAVVLSVIAVVTSIVALKTEQDALDLQRSSVVPVASMFATVEEMTPPSDDSEFLEVWAVFDSAVLDAEVEVLQIAIESRPDGKEAIIRLPLASPLQVAVDDNTNEYRWKVPKSKGVYDMLTLVRDIRSDHTYGHAIVVQLSFTDRTGDSHRWWYEVPVLGLRRGDRLARVAASFSWLYDETLQYAGHNSSLTDRYVATISANDSFDGDILCPQELLRAFDNGYFAEAQLGRSYGFPGVRDDLAAALAAWCPA